LRVVRLQFATAPLVARFFEEERLVPILRVLAINSVDDLHGDSSRA
jgi:hypothetical protein